MRPEPFEDGDNGDCQWNLTLCRPSPRDVWYPLIAVGPEFRPPIMFKLEIYSCRSLNSIPGSFAPDVRVRGRKVIAGALRTSGRLLA